MTSHSLKGATRALFVSLGILMFVPGTSQASHYTGSCSLELNAVETSINSAVFLGRNATTDKSNLLAKLDAANAKISQAKYGDAIDKLVDISDAATALAGAAKPKLDDATGINTAVGAAVSCVGLLK